MAVEMLDQEEAGLISPNRRAVGVAKGVKFSAEELDKLDKWGQWLATTVNPLTGRPFISRPIFSQVVQFALNTAWNVTKEVAREMAEAEAEEAL